MAAITTAEIKFYFSTKSGSAGSSLSSTAPNSLGKYISTTEWTNGATLFDDISGAENTAGTTDYRCIFIYNTNASNALQNAVVYLSAETAGGAKVQVAVDNIAASAFNAAGAQAAEITNETTAPSGVGTYTTLDTTGVGNGVSLGNIPANSVKAVWIKRIAQNSAALSNDGFTIAVAGDTGSL